MESANQKGFTLIEVMVVIIVMALLSVLALPKAISIITQAKKASAHAVVAAIRSGISNNKIESISEGSPIGNYPPGVTTNATIALCGNIPSGCFDDSPGHNITDNRWRQDAAGGAGRYTFDLGGSAECTYTYNNTNGTFLASNITGCQ